MTTPDRASTPTPETTPPDPKVVMRHVNDVRNAEVTVIYAKRDLAAYLSEHAADRCEYGTGDHRATLSRIIDDEGRRHFDCSLEVDGFVLLSCGHNVFTCATGGSRILAEIASSREVACMRRDEIHAAPVYGIRAEWVGLA